MPGSTYIARDIVEDGLSSWDAAPFLQKVTEIIPNLIYIFNQQTQSNEYSNRSIAEALGYSADEIMEMGADMIPLLAHPDDMIRISAQFQRILSLADGEVSHVEYRMKSKAGSWIWLQSADMVFDRDENGAVLHHIGVATDVTALKQAEQTARAEHKKAEATSEELRSFAYSVTHDLKSPSNTLNLVLNELLESHAPQLDEDASELVDMALKTVTRMERQIEDVLDYTRVIGHDFNPAPTDLNPLIAALVGKIAKAPAQITVSDLPVVRADSAQMQIFFYKLLENAIKFQKPDQSPQVSITSEIKPDNGFAVITVQDNGIGIHASRHAQVFQIFKRLNSPLDYEGSGLGLSICQRIAANHDTRVTLVSAPDQGAAFSIALPLVE